MILQHSQALPLLHRCELQKGQVLGLTRFGQNQTIYRSGADALLAAERCSHRGTSLQHAKVCEQDQTLICPYHGKKNSPLQKLYSAFDFVWTKDPSAYFSSVPKHFHFCGALSFTMPAPYHVVLDNFNEGSHTAFVHGLLGPQAKQMNAIEFQWEKKQDHVNIQYQGPQRKNFLFYGFNFFKKIDWQIEWRSYFNPSYMRYHSRWINTKTSKKILSENINYYFINPVDEKTTHLSAFVFTEKKLWMKPLWFLVKKVALWMTWNQIQEDVNFYKKIQDLPRPLNGMLLDRYDQPLLALRQAMHDIYKKYL